jgi:hypothetical protein
LRRPGQPCANGPHRRHDDIRLLVAQLPQRRCARLLNIACGGRPA